MNVCLVNNIYPPINTGSTYYTQGLANSLLQHGHKVVVITNQYQDKNYLEIEQEIKVYRLPVIKLPKLEIWMKFPDFNFSLTLSNYKRFNRILLDEQIQIIHQCNNIFDLIFFSAHFSTKLKIPLVCSIMTQIQHSNTFYNRLLVFFETSIIRHFFAKKVSAFIALDEESVCYINNRFNLGKNIIFIPYLIQQTDINHFYKHKKIDYKKTHFQMISLGHISNLKNRLEIIKAWKYVLKEIPQARLLIVGGIFSKKAKKLIQELNLSEHISFTGRVDHEKITDYIELSDFSCMFLSEDLPYHRGVGGASFEMMASGLPTVLDASNNFFGIQFPFVSDEHFIQAENRNERYLADIFISLFKQPDLREKIGKNGQKYVTQNLNWTTIIEKLENCYKTLIGFDNISNGQQ